MAEVITDTDFDLISASRRLYRPVEPYQTRIVILHGDGGSRNSTVTCNLLSAAFPHPDFSPGIFCISSDKQNEITMIEFTALSYVWGVQSRNAVIICNDVAFPISANLYAALKELRPQGNGTLAIWVDAICINQIDEIEKSQQVRNILKTFRTASVVTGWLGSIPSEFQEDEAMDPKLFSLDRRYELSAKELRALTRYLRHLYQMQWFRRVWIQQEVFAARALRFRWGPINFDPAAIEVPGKSEIKAGDTDLSNALYEAHKELPQIRELELQFFDMVKAQYQQLKIYDVLLKSAHLEATNPRDYIYGVLGLIDFPSRAMSIGDWLKDRGENLRKGLEPFIPIDYAADLSDILCAVTWSLAMRYGLDLIEHLKVFPPYRAGATDDQLPSWVVDWKIAGQLHGLEAFHEQSFIAKLGYVEEVAKLCEFNLNSSVTCRVLWLRGAIARWLYIDDGWVCEKWRYVKHSTTQQIQVKKRWYLGSVVKPSDIVVDIGLPGKLKRKYILRQVDDEHYRFIACLTPKSSTPISSQVSENSSIPRRLVTQMGRTEFRQPWREGSYEVFDANENFLFVGPRTENLERPNERMFAII